MRQTLTLHPESRCAAAARVEVDVARPRPGGLALTYVVTGAIGDLSLPPASAPARADGLWRHTCFEAFVRASPGTAYYEFNLAPSRQWAAYRFGDARKDMSVANEVDTPGIEVQSDGKFFELRAALDLDRLPDLSGDAPWRLGLSAVIKEAGGRLSYWALAHPPGRADFHDAHGFALTLPLTEA